MQIAKNMTEDWASSLNEEVVNDIKSSTKSIILPIPDLDSAEEQFENWSEEFAKTKTIKGFPIIQWVKQYVVDISKEHLDEYTSDALFQLLRSISSKLTKAHWHLRTAKLKYNAIVISGADRYLVEYSNILDPNKTGDSAAILNRNFTKEKIKMLAESKNRETIIMAMMGHEEVEFFEGIVKSLNSTMEIVKLILQAKAKKLKYLRMDNACLICINGTGNDYSFDISPPYFNIANIPIVAGDFKKYSIWATTFALKIEHTEFYEIEYNILSSVHSVKYEEKNDIWILKMDELTNLQLKIGFDDNGMWVRICN